MHVSYSLTTRSISLRLCFSNEGSQELSPHWASYMQLVLFCLPLHYIKSHILKKIKLKAKSNVGRKFKKSLQRHCREVDNNSGAKLGLKGSKSSGKHPKNMSKSWQPQHGSLTRWSFFSLGHGKTLLLTQDSVSQSFAPIFLWEFKILH